MIQARLLQQFIAVAEELHFGRAAARLHMSQPPLSQAIRHLEDIVGVPLFERSRHYVALTAAGAAFVDEAHALLAAGRRAIDAARRASEGSVGHVSIGFVGSVCYDVLPRVLQTTRKRLPTLHIDLFELASTKQAAALRDGQIDVGIVRIPLADATGISFREIARERFIAVLPADHPLAAVPELHLRDLADQPFMAFPAERVPGLHAKFLLACDEAGFSPCIALEAWQMASMVSLVAAGVGVALLPEQVRRSPQAGVVYRDLADPSDHLSLSIAVAWLPERLPAVAQAVLNVILTHENNGRMDCVPRRY